MLTCCRQIECSIATSPQLNLVAPADVPDSSSVVTGDFWRTQLTGSRCRILRPNKVFLFKVRAENTVRDVLAIQTGF